MQITYFVKRKFCLQVNYLGLVCTSQFTQPKKANSWAARQKPIMLQRWWSTEGLCPSAHFLSAAFEIKLCKLRFLDRCSFLTFTSKVTQWIHQLIPLLFLYPPTFLIVQLEVTLLSCFRYNRISLLQTSSSLLWIYSFLKSYFMNAILILLLFIWMCSPTIKDLVFFLGNAAGLPNSF